MQVASLQVVVFRGGVLLETINWPQIPFTSTTIGILAEKNALTNLPPDLFSLD
ncbi:MAG: hypothetical protein GY796_36920 [Chloroflexi bacterium]|nr:hypothetical protein [Chloroflexota bacterium]